MIKPTSLKIIQFGKEGFFEAVRSPQMTRAQAEDDRRARYLFDYLTAMKAETVAIEDPYVDGGYLDDFAHYYVKSFNDYERRCKRLHFFSEAINETEFLEAVVEGKSARRLQGAYLGFVVVRPLPEAIVGRTLMAPYPPDNGRRHYPVVAKHRATLCGLPLDVESLPFQQQDRVLAACATVALWSSFQHCAKLFGTPAPSPAEITRHANTVVTSSRALPSQGLTLEQMCRAVGAVGLEPEVVACTQDVPLLSLIRGYLAGGLPVIAIVYIEGIGRHAIALAGYSLRNTLAMTREDFVPTSPTVRRIGLRIDELYGHDDGVGPFARLHVREQADADADDDSGDEFTNLYFEGDWKIKDGTRAARLKPRYLLIPVYHKIRLTYMDVQKWIAPLNQLLALPMASPETFEWDITLTTVNDLKTSAATALPVELQRRVILGAYPRFIWRAAFSANGRKVLELLFDATDMDPAYPFCDLLVLEEPLRIALTRMVHSAEMVKALDLLLGPQFHTFLKNQLPQ
jgi:hypothetical protein